MDRKLLKTVQTITAFRNRLADPVGTRRGPPLVRGPQFENRYFSIKSRIFSRPHRISSLRQTFAMADRTTIVTVVSLHRLVIDCSPGYDFVDQFP